MTRKKAFPVHPRLSTAHTQVNSLSPDFWRHISKQRKEKQNKKEGKKELRERRRETKLWAWRDRRRGKKSRVKKDTKVIDTTDRH